MGNEGSLSVGTSLFFAEVRNPKYILLLVYLPALLERTISKYTIGWYEPVSLKSGWHRYCQDKQPYRLKTPPISFNTILAAFSNGLSLKFVFKFISKARNMRYVSCFSYLFVKICILLRNFKKSFTIFFKKCLVIICENSHFAV